MIATMKAMPRVARVMTPFPFAIDATADIAAAWAMMEEHDIRHIPVVRGDEVLGVVSERDLWRAEAEGRGDIDMAGLAAYQAYVIEWNTSLEEVAREMSERKIGSAVVLHEGRLAGIVTTTDMLDYMIRLLERSGVDNPAEMGG